MADYWKSIPKKYCDFCKCWITDNQTSRDFHEKGFRHQANVRRKIKEIQKNNSTQEKERQQYYHELLKIEAAALNSFKNDIAKNPSLASEYSSTKSIASQLLLNNSKEKYTDKNVSINRFGECYEGFNESTSLLNGKRRALETIAKSFEKKSKWLEAKTSDGQSYYWNKETLETRHDPPKSGFLSLSEQDQLKTFPISNDDDQPISNKVFRPDPYGGWRSVEKQDTEKMIDLQLPNQNISQIVIEMKQGDSSTEDKKIAVEFKEKTVESLNKPMITKNENVSFKKRINNQRNIRNRLEDEQ